MNLIFKKSLITLLFGFAFFSIFYSTPKVEAAAVPTTAYATLSGHTNYSNPLTVLGANKVDIWARPSTTATSCTLAGHADVPANPVVGGYTKVGSRIPVSQTTTFTVTCDYTETYSWSVGTWGACTSSGAGVCSGSWISSAGACVGPVGAGNQTNPYNCTGIIGQTTCQSAYNDGCRWDTTGTKITNQCVGPTTSSACTSQNAACSFVYGGSSQTRTVVCKNSLGTTVADSFCTASKPISSQACTVPINGVCGSTVNSCTAGIFTYRVNSSTYYLWECSGYNGGTNALCSSPIPAPTGGGGGGGGCFIAGTKVEMADGSFKNIEDVTINDSLMSSAGPTPVMKRYVIDYFGLVYSINGSKFFVTDSHPFMTTEGWKSFNPEKTRKESPTLKVGLLEKFLSGKQVFS